jgi:hypothetical protein
MLKALSDNKITIYPVINGHKFLVMVEDNLNAIYRNKKTKGKQTHTSATINQAIIDTIKYCYSKLKSNKL